MADLTAEARARLNEARDYARRERDHYVSVMLRDLSAALATIDSLTAEVERLRESVSASAAQYDALAQEREG